MANNISNYQRYIYERERYFHKIYIFFSFVFRILNGSEESLKICFLERSGLLTI